ncbi:MAG: hypothetical protein ACE5G2_01645 [Candidatus Krumholzibacteriia bacterium]
MGATVGPQRGTIRKTLWVRRSDRTPMLYWWSLPLSLRTFASLYEESLRTSRALVRPAVAVAGCAPEIGARPVEGNAMLVSDVTALLEARDDGRAGACSIIIFPATHPEEALERSAHQLQEGLERLGFTMAIVPEDDGRIRHQFCFRVPGKVLEAIEHLAHGRRFGGNLGRVEMALLQGLLLRPKQVARLRLVMENGGASLVGIDRAGRRRIHYLESGKGYTGTYEEMTLREAVGARARESWRRFPIGVVMFAGLPFFIGAFWAKNILSRRGDEASRPGAAKRA